MNDPTEATTPSAELKCPECRAQLKRRRSRHADECEMVCGGCGQTFDVCDMDTVAELTKKAP
jgi:predicted nucleic acid-binding Zn ribbon protein